MSRWKAASIHLSISIAIALLVLALLVLVWYPPPYFSVAGGQRLFFVLLGVHLGIGPLLTLLLFKSGKKGLVFDLCMVGIFQASALIYGLIMTAEARPVFIVAAVDRFILIAANELDSADLADGKEPGFRSLSWTGPRLIGAQLPPGGEERADLLFQSLSGGKDVHHLPKYYVDYESVAAALLKRGRTLASLREAQPAAVPMLDAWLKERSLTDDRVVWVPVLARKSGLTMLLDARSGNVLEALPISPW